MTLLNFLNIRLVWVTLIAIIAVIVLTGTTCTQQTAETTDTDADKQAATIQEGGDFVYAMLEEPDGLVGYASGMAFAVNASNLFFDGLTKINDKFETVAWLAVEVPTKENGGISEDGKTVTYKLREGVKWHDGEDFTSADVKATWDWIMNPKNTLIPSRAGYDQVASVETPDDHTVVFKLRDIYAPFVDTLFQYGILPAHIIEKETDPTKSTLLRKPVGTGPFVIVSWTAGESIIAKKNPDYFMGEPHLDRIILRLVGDENTILVQLKGGELDGWELVSPPLISQVESISGMKLHRQSAVIWETYAFNLSDNGDPDKPHPILGDKNVRKALETGANVKKIVEQVYPGEYRNIAITSQYPESYAYNDELKPVPYDAEQAKKLLEEAGWTDEDGDGIRAKGGKPLSLTISTTTGKKDREQKELLLQQNWRDIGVDLKIKNYDAGTLFGAFTEGGILATGKYDVAIFAWAAQVDPADGATLFMSDQIPTQNNPAGQNQYFFKNAEVDKLATEAVKTVDREERATSYKRIQEIVQDEVPGIFERYWQNVNAVSESIHEFKANPTNQGNLWNTHEYWKEKKAES